jgi:transitional endoplasmic reticulum ATPase
MNVNLPSKTPIVGDDAQIDWTRIDTGLEFNGKKIVLPGEPGEMPYQVAIDTIERIAEAEAQVYAVTEHVDGLPWDSAVALYRAMQQIYGVVLPQSIPTWFGPKPPSFLTIRVGVADTDLIQVPMGNMSLPGIKKPVRVGINYAGAFIAGEVNKKDQARLIEIANLARQFIRRDSIYRGKAIALKVDEDGDLMLDEQPAFLDLATVKETDLIHNELTEAIIRTAIFAPLKHTDDCRRHNIPLKRGILLEGRWGCGKSLTARVTAKIAQDNGWSFLLIDRAQGLKAALTMARRYEPCVVFAEDLDRFADRGDEKVNALINDLDGLVPASAAVMTILTTNHVENIDKALLRPGRLDAVISIDAPDAQTVTRVIRHYASTLLAPDTDLARVGAILAGQIPAAIAEIVKRAKLAMLVEGRGHLEEADLVIAAESAMRHLALLEDKAEEPTPGDKLAEILTGFVTEGVNGHAETLMEKLADIRNQV